MNESIYVYTRDGVVVLPVSKPIKELLEFKAAANKDSLSELTRKIIGGLCDRLDIPFDHASIKAEARKRDRDVQGFIDNWIRDNVRIKISEFEKMDAETKHKYLNFAKSNISLTAGWTINALGYIYKGWKGDLNWTAELKHIIDEHLSMLRETRKQSLPDSE